MLVEELFETVEVALVFGLHHVHLSLLGLEPVHQLGHLLLKLLEPLILGAQLLGQLLLLFLVGLEVAFHAVVELLGEVRLRRLEVLLEEPGEARDQLRVLLLLLDLGLRVARELLHVLLQEVHLRRQHVGGLVVELQLLLGLLVQWHVLVQQLVVLGLNNVDDVRALLAHAAELLHDLQDQRVHVVRGLLVLLQQRAAVADSVQQVVEVRVLDLARVVRLDDQHLVVHELVAQVLEVEAVRVHLLLQKFELRLELQSSAIALQDLGAELLVLVHQLAQLLLLLVEAHPVLLDDLLVAVALLLVLVVRAEGLELLLVDLAVGLVLAEDLVELLLQNLELGLQAPEL